MRNFRNKKLWVVAGTIFLTSLLGVLTALQIHNALSLQEPVELQHKTDSLLSEQDLLKSFHHQSDLFSQDFHQLDTKHLFSLTGIGNPIVQTENLPDEYKITVNLKSFGGKADQVKISVQGYQVVISGQAQTKNKDKNSFNSASFYNSFYLPEPIDVSKINKVESGDRLIISIQKDKSLKRNTLPNQDTITPHHTTPQEGGTVEKPPSYYSI